MKKEKKIKINNVRALTLTRKGLQKLGDPMFLSDPSLPLVTGGRKCE